MAAEHGREAPTHAVEHGVSNAAVCQAAVRGDEHQVVIDPWPWQAMGPDIVVDDQVLRP